MLNARRSLGGLQATVALGGVVLLEALFFCIYRLGDLKLYAVETIELALAAGIVYFIALYALERVADHRAAFWLVLAGGLLFRLTLAPLLPTLSDDIYRYRFDGRVQQTGWNPYTVRPDDPQFASWREPGVISIPGHDARSVYPPLAQLVYRLTWRILPGPLGFKLPFVLADLLVLAWLAIWVRRTRARNHQLAIYAWNPLVVVEFAATGHNDSLALAAVIAALLIIGRRETLSTMALAAAALAKAFPLALFPLWLRRSGWPGSLRGWGNALAALAVAVVCSWPYRTALAQVPASLAYYQSRWQGNNTSVYWLLAWFSGSPELAIGLGIGVVAGLALWLAARCYDPACAAYLLFGAILLLGPNGYSWYFTWVVPFLCFLPSAGAAPAWLLLTILQFLSYHVLIGYQASGTWHFQPAMVWLIYAPFYAVLLWEQLCAARPRSDRQ